MQDSRTKSSYKFINGGYSLVELIVVIAIMTVMVGVISLGVGVMFSRDAQSAATIIDDALSTAREYSMTKPGDFVMTIHCAATGTYKDTESEYNYITISNGAATDSVNETIKFKTGALISYAIDDGGTVSYVAPSDNDITIEFSKANGSVTKIDGSAVSGGSILRIKCVAVRNQSRIANVELMSVTGKHSVK